MLFRSGRRGPRPAKVQRKGSRHHGDQNYRTLTGLDTGYSLRGRRQQIDFDNRHRGLLSRYGISNRMLILGAAAVVIVLIAALSIASCVQGQSSEQPTQTHQEDTDATNQWDSRVSANTPKDLTSKFTTVLDRNEKFATIAKNADRYPDARLPELAINEPAAIDFVAAYPTAEHRATDYGQTNEKGEFPQLFNWDIRWGYVDYVANCLLKLRPGTSAFEVEVLNSRQEEEINNVSARLLSFLADKLCNISSDTKSCIIHFSSKTHLPLLINKTIF